MVKDDRKNRLVRKKGIQGRKESKDGVKEEQTKGMKVGKKGRKIKMVRK